MLLKFGNGALTYKAMTHGTIPGQYKYFIFFRRLQFRDLFKTGCRVFVKLLSNKTVFCQLMYKRDTYTKYIRSAGTYTRLYQRYLDYRLISCRLPTKKVKYITYTTLVTLGRNSNIKHKREFLTSAGMNIKKGFKSKVRGVAMNPVDHPHGGRTKSNNPEKSP
jgi:large subunit ribosomal protein L2